MIQTQSEIAEAECAPVAPEVLLILRRIKRALNEVLLVTSWEWRNSCSNAADPKRHVLHWLRVAQLYRACRPEAVRIQQIARRDRFAAAE